VEISFDVLWDFGGFLIRGGLFFQIFMEFWKIQEIKNSEIEKIQKIQIFREFKKKNESSQDPIPQP
jgi:hypothetical protein